MIGSFNVLQPTVREPLTVCFCSRSASGLRDLKLRMAVILLHWVKKSVFNVNSCHMFLQDGNDIVNKEECASCLTVYGLNRFLSI